MGSNRFGNYFQVTTWGESHGEAIGCIIDGCPAGIRLSDEDLQADLHARAPGNSPYTSPRKEQDGAKILSGVFEGVTTGAPIAVEIANRDADSAPYDQVRQLMKPGHAQFAYLEKYGVFDHRGGGRASARETACRVAAGAVARRLLKASGILCKAQLIRVGALAVSLASETSANAILAECLQEGDSVGGVVEFIVTGAPAGLGDPVYEKLSARLAFAMMSIPAARGFEIGEGFSAAEMQGSQHNDSFVVREEKISPETNHAGGVLGGISTGMPIIGRVAFKPASSIRKEQKTVDSEGRPALFALKEGSKHDPCVAIRAVPVVEAMALLVVADALLAQRLARA